MNKLHTLKTMLAMAALAASLALPLAHAATMAKADYQSGKTRIADTYKADKNACASSNGNVKDICIEEAKGKEKVAKAELEYAYSGKTNDANKVMVAKADSSYAVAKERCDDQAGNAKDVCVKEAKAVHVKALADAKLGKEIGTARKDAAADKNDADYKVAAEKCEASSGDAKTACMSAAKSRYGKT